MKQGQSYVWKVEARQILKHESRLDRVFKNKVDALSYLQSLMNRGYKQSKLVKWSGK